jgi:membrane fusion protein (multidrug efflux system)
MESALTIAELSLSYTTVRAARRGVVSRRSVEEGQIVSPERPLLAIVPLDDVWVVANFKEDQLGAMAVGDQAAIEVDTYAGHRLQAHVDSMAGGTGARFALLPPDNATGNFVKVVQRVPVLLRIDDTAGLELRPGMSAEVTVDTRTR